MFQEPTTRAQSQPARSESVPSSIQQKVVLGPSATCRVAELWLYTFLRVQGDSKTWHVAHCPTAASHASLTAGGVPSLRPALARGLNRLPGSTLFTSRISGCLWHPDLHLAPCISKYLTHAPRVCNVSLHMFIQLGDVDEALHGLGLKMR